MHSYDGQHPEDQFGFLLQGPRHDKRVYSDITQLLSDEFNPTPLVKLNHVTGFKHAELYAKLEWCNPSGSVKVAVRDCETLHERKECAGTCSSGSISSSSTHASATSRYPAGNDSRLQFEKHSASELN
eukprot:794425-Amphidinium_carterae.1